VAYYATTGAGIKDPSQGPISQLSIFPNPASGSIVIAFEISQNVSASISIVNQIGQEMINSEVLTENQTMVNQHIDISTLPSGIYFASVRCSCGKQLTEKFVVR
jgi:hypothetical protein